MKKIIPLLLILNAACCIFNSAFAQAPQAIPYQAVARDTAGNPIINKNISLRFSIHNATPGGTVVYKETQATTTNLLGLFTVNIGQGTVVSGTFDSINWAIASKYLQVELDTAAGSNYINMGTEQMLSVPYAFYSGTSSGGWSLNGNAGTDTSDFIGTIDDKPLLIKLNNIKGGRIEPYLYTDPFLVNTSNNIGNTFLGASAGANSDPNNHNTAGRNSFFGTLSGSNILNGSNNSFFGFGSGNANTNGSSNSFLGQLSGLNNTTGSLNSFFGSEAGDNNTTGSKNTYIGFSAVGAGAGNLTNSTALGAYAKVDVSNALVLGSIAGVNNATVGVNVGIGTTTPTAKLHVVGNTLIEGEVHKPSSGNANLLPVAYGQISGAGTIINTRSSGNFTCSWNSNLFQYDIIVDGEADHSSYIFIGNPLGTSTGVPIISSPTGGVSSVRVIIRDVSDYSGNPIQHGFHFVLFKP